MCEQFKLGVPILVVCREVLQQATIGDALGAIIRANRAQSLNFLVADENGEIYDIEATPKDIDYFYSDKYMAHSNHFLSKKLGFKRDIIVSAMPDTIIRYNRMNRLLREKCGTIDLKALMEFTKDHVNYPYSICRHKSHGASPEQAIVTLDSFIFVPAKKEMWIARGNPCQNEFIRYAL
jgi:isopenicillin-N N-acyltransferase-like protein